MGAALLLMLISMPGSAQDEWRRQRPLQLLETLQRHPGTFFLTTHPPERGFVHPEDLEDGWTPDVPVPAPMHHAARVDFQNLDEFGHLRFGVWKEARLTFKVLRADVNPIDPPRRWNTSYVAKILRVE